MEKIDLKRVLFSSCSFKIKCLKLFDYVVGGTLCRLVPHRILFKKQTFNKPIDISKIERVLIIRPGGIGDAVLTIPFIKEVKRILNVKIDLLVDKRNREVFDLESELIDKIFCYNQRNIFTLFLNLQKNRYDIIFDTEQWHNFSVLTAYLLGARVIVGFNTRKLRSKFYTHLVAYSQNDYEAYSFLNLLSTLVPNRVRKELTVPFLHPFDTPLPYLNRLSTDKKKIVLCISTTIPEKRWPTERLRELIDILLSKGFQVVLVGGKKEINLVNSIIKGVKNNDLLNFVGKLSLKQTATILKSCDIFIGFDSGILHLACGLGLSTISLFGSGIKEKWAFQYDRHIVLHKNLFCSPCTIFGYTPHCPRGIECMWAIGVEEVLSAIERLISSGKDR